MAARLLGTVCKPMRVRAALLIAFALWAPAWQPAGAQTSAECPPAFTGATVRTAMSAEGAVCALVQATDSVYAGDCAATMSPRDIGKICSKLIGQRGSLRAYLVGRTFSEFNAWVFIEQTRAGWTPLGTAPLDFAAPALIVPWPEHTVTPDGPR